MEINKETKFHFAKKYLRNAFRYKMPLHFMVILFSIVFLHINHCDITFRKYFLITFGIISLYGLLDPYFWVIKPLLTKEKPGKDEKTQHFLLPMAISFYYGTVLALTTDVFYHYDGVSIIRPTTLNRIEINHSRDGSEIYHSNLNFIDKGKIRYGVHHLSDRNVYYRLLQPYVIVPVDCENIPLLTEYCNRSNYSIIHDFAFLEDTTFFTYHDYSLKNPDLVYYQVGFNTIFKATSDSINIQDSTILLNFNDICNINHSVKYSIKGFESIPDTLLIYRNINEDIDTKWRVCAQEINTSENRAKISDYGYIFHYDICSKEEIETQCPRIKEYVNKYKERNR